MTKADFQSCLSPLLQISRLARQSTKTEKIIKNFNLEINFLRVLTSVSGIDIASRSVLSTAFRKPLSVSTGKMCSTAAPIS